MAESGSRRKSLRKNMRTSYKSMLDPLEEDKYGNKNKSLFQSLGLYCTSNKQETSDLNSTVSPETYNSVASSSNSLSKVPSTSSKTQIESSVMNKTNFNLNDGEKRALKQLSILNNNQDPIVKLKQFQEVDLLLIPNSIASEKKDGSSLNVETRDDLLSRGKSLTEKSSSEYCLNGSSDQESINILKRIKSNKDLNVSFKSSMKNEASGASNHSPREKSHQKNNISESFLNEVSCVGSKSNNDKGISETVSTASTEKLNANQEEEDFTVLKSKELLRCQKKVTISPNSPLKFDLHPSTNVDLQEKSNIVNKRKSILKGSPNLSAKFENAVSPHQPKTKVRISTSEGSSGETRASSELREKDSVCVDIPVVQDAFKQASNVKVLKREFGKHSNDKTKSTKSKPIQAKRDSVVKKSLMLESKTSPVRGPILKSSNTGTSEPQITNLPNESPHSEELKGKLDSSKLINSTHLEATAGLESVSSEIASSSFVGSLQQGESHEKVPLKGSQSKATHSHGLKTCPSESLTKKEKPAVKEEMTNKEELKSNKLAGQLNPSKQKNYNKRNRETYLNASSKPRKRGRPTESFSEKEIFTPTKLNTSSTSSHSEKDEGQTDPNITSTQRKRGRGRPRKSFSGGESFTSPNLNKTLNNSVENIVETNSNITPKQKKASCKKSSNEDELFKSTKSCEKNENDEVDAEQINLKKLHPSHKSDKKRKKKLIKNLSEGQFVTKSDSVLECIDAVVAESESVSDINEMPVSSQGSKTTKRPYQKRNQGLKPVCLNKRKTKNLAETLLEMHKKKKKQKLFTGESMLFPSPTTAEGSPTVGSSDVDHTGDMPLIFSSSSSPEVTKNSQIKVKQNFKQCHIAMKKEKSARRKSLKEPSTKKKRGRKRIKLFEMKPDASEDDALPQGGGKKERKKSQRRTGRRFSVTGNWYIAAGYLNDIISLLEDFDSADSWRFKEFAKCWRAKSFSLVYRGRQTFKELLEFSEEIALLTKRFLGPPHSIKRRIGALYTLYGLCHKFPLGRRHFFNLRFEMEEYKNLLELVQPFRSNMENPDPAYIFRKLELEGSVLHCATAYEPCYDFHNEEREYVEVEYGKQRLAKSSAVNIAVPKVQLQTDSNLLHHYHSMKARLAGDEDKPERALCMISSDFLTGISSNLMQLRQNTLTELGMLEDNAGLGAGPEVEINVNVDDPGSHPKVLEVEADEVMHTVDQHVLATVNNSLSGQRTHKVIENNQMTKDQSVKEFMRPPDAKDLLKPLKLQQKKTGKTKTPSRKAKPSYSMDWNDNVNNNTFKAKVEPRDGRVMLDIESGAAQYEELREALLPQHMPLKKKRGRKRPAALLEAASYVPRGRKERTETPLVKTLVESDGEEVLPISSAASKQTSPASKQTSSATRFLVSELVDVKPVVKESATTMVKVRLKADGVVKTVKLKVKVNLEQFKEIQKNEVRYTNFKNKLKPLIKATQKGKNKDREWLIDDIVLQSEIENKENVETPKKSEEKEQVGKCSPESWTPTKNLSSLKQRYECLRHSDDEKDDEDSNDVYDPFSDEEDARKMKKKDQQDTDYDFVKAEREQGEAAEDPLEYECEDDNDEGESDFEPEQLRIRRWSWRKRGKRRWDGTWEDDRGPRDSDYLLKPESDSATKSVSMVPLRVGNTVKYIPMINSESKSNTAKDVQTHTKSLEEDPPFCSDPGDSMYKYTWNDYSSEKEPPLKKRRSWRSSLPSYIFSPRIQIKGEQSPPKLKEPTSPAYLSEEEEEEDVVFGETIETFDSPELPSSRPHSASPTLVPIKKEAQTVLKELADDWEEPLDTSQMENDRDDDSLSEGGEGSVSHVETNVLSDVEIAFNYTNNPVSHHGASDMNDQPDSPIQIIDHLPQQQHVNNMYSHKNNSFSDEVTEILPEISEILPDISIPTSSVYGNNIQVIPVQMDKNLPLEMAPESILPGTFLFDENIEGSMLQSTDQNGVLPQNILNMDLCNADSKQPLYYKMTASDGNDLFIPISVLPEMGSKKIEILSFDMADVKPFSPSKSVSFSPPKSLSIVNSPPPCIPSSRHSPEEIQSYIPDTPCVSTGSTSSQNLPFKGSFSPSTPCSSQSSSSAPPPSKDPSLRSFPPSTPPSSYPRFQAAPPPPSAAPRSSPFSPPSLPNRGSSMEPFSSKPSCSFLFSPKLTSFKHLNSAAGLASGKPPPPPQQPKVKFLFKGFLKSRK